METSEARLRNTRFFEKVTLDDEPIKSNDPSFNQLEEISLWMLRKGEQDMFLLE